MAWLERSRSTPATFSPMMLAARTAVERSSGVILIRAEEPPRCRLERNSPWRALALHRGRDLAIDDETADVGAAGLLDEFLDQDVGLDAHETPR